MKPASGIHPPKLLLSEMDIEGKSDRIFEVSTRKLFELRFRRFPSVADQRETPTVDDEAAHDPTAADLESASQRRLERGPDHCAGKS